MKCKHLSSWPNGTWHPRALRHCCEIIESGDSTLRHAILNDVLSRKPEKPLYHYTTQTGLLGIIKDRQILATHTQYLNDRREFLHAVDLVRGEIQRLLNEQNTRTV
jgi:hypothetical protein